METKQEGNVVVVKLSDGEDLVPSLEAAAQKHRIESGSVVWGIGMLQDFEIGFFGPKGYEKTPFTERHELLALHGSIAMREIGRASCRERVEIVVVGGGWIE